MPRDENLESTRIVNEIVATLNKEERKNMGFKPNERGYLSRQQEKFVIKRFILKKDKLPVAFFDILADGISGTVCYAVRHGYHGKGYGSKVAELGSNWVDEHLQDYDNIAFAVLETNKPSIKIAKKFNWHRCKSRDYTNSVGKFIVFVKSKHWN